ncbi:hypothetical protein WMW72_30345 [Paenibacillus filicis]|uniref:Methyl-accepting chemotaxis protein n=1 Tax=Paenibacillus filicis TaxID=669464 RepID=A0ABU9DVR8_9BACL
MMSRIPGVIRNVNEGLDELRGTMDKVNSLFQTAEQMSPVLMQIAQVVAEVRERAKPASRPLRLSEASGRSSGGRRTRSRRSAGRRQAPSKR